MKSVLSLFLAGVFSALCVGQVYAYPLPYNSAIQTGVSFAQPPVVNEGHIISTTRIDNGSAFKPADITTADMGYSAITAQSKGLLTTQTMASNDDNNRLSTATMDNNNSGPHLKGTMLYTVRGIHYYQY